MALLRNGIQDFELANPIYKGATVTFYTVDVDGVKTTTRAVLYSTLGGTGTLANPQFLGADGKFVQPVYMSEAVVATVSGLTIPDHDTGVIWADYDYINARAAAAAASESNAAASESNAAASESNAAASAATFGVDTVAALRLLTPVDDALIQIKGYYAPGDGGGGPLRVGVTGAAPGTYVDNGGSIIVPTGGDGSAAWLWEWSGAVNVQWFGAVGNGVTDDTAALNAFFSTISGKISIMPAGTYKATSLLTLLDLANCTILGAPGQTVITGSFGYGLMLLAELDHVHFYGIEFNSTYVNAAPSGNTGVVYQGDDNVYESSFRHCKFTSPDAQTQGLVFFNRTNAVGAATCVIDGLWIEDNEFTDIGSSGCTIMNRQESSDKYSAMKRVYFNRNKGKTLGYLAAAATSGTYGMLVSLDGFGSTFTVDHNECDDTKGASIENTQWINGSMSFNKGRNLSRGNTRLMSAGDASATYPASGLTVVGNVCEDDASVGSYASFCNDSYFAGNIWRQADTSSSADRAFSFLDSNRNVVSGDQYISDQKYAVRFVSSTGTVFGNRLRDIRADTSASAINVAVVNFDGASTTDNIVEGAFSKGTGGSVFTQTTSAVGNAIGYDAVTTGSLSLTFATPGDLSYTGTAPYRCTRKGRICTLTFELSSSVFTHSTAAGALRITGLPYKNGSQSYYGSLGAFQGITKANYTHGGLRVVGGQTYMQIYLSGQGQTVATAAATDMPSGGSVLLFGAVTYETDDA